MILATAKRLKFSIYLILINIFLRYFQYRFNFVLLSLFYRLSTTSWSIPFSRKLAVLNMEITIFTETF